VAIEADGAAFAISSEGVYHVAFDQTSAEAILVKIDRWGIIGASVFADACNTDGWNSDVELPVKSSSADGTVWELAGVILKEGQFKVRYNTTWDLKRNDAYDDTRPEANNYDMFTNLGQLNGSLTQGGDNHSIAAADAGVYTVTLTLDADGVMSMSTQKTGEAEACAFDPSNYSWGIIGGGTYDDWNSQKNLTYVNGDGGVHKWRGVFVLEGSATTGDAEFKFRTDDTWATKMTPGTEGVTVTVTNNSSNITDNSASSADASWFVADGASGFYYIEITTADQGSTWTITLDDAAWEIIGAATGDDSWTTGIALSYDDNLSSASATTALVDGDFKFRVNASWDFNLGGTLGALIYNDSNNLSATAGTYTVTLTTADGGVTYTATVQ